MAKIPAEKGQIEEGLKDSGLIAGVDEVGRGCIAGPVYAAAAIVDMEKISQLASRQRALIRDSKTLSRKQRQEALLLFGDLLVSSSVGVATVREIEKHGISAATFIAMGRAIAGMDHDFETLLVDGNVPLPHYLGRQIVVVKGDSLCFAIAAASILAKASRDAYMVGQAKKYPVYGFESHVGYGTQKHISSIEVNGICSLHRKTFAPVKRYVDLVT